MGNMRDAMVFYRSFADAIRELEPEEQLAALWGIIDYALDEKEPSCKGGAKAVCLMARPQIDANNSRYQNGHKGGRKKNQTETKVEPNPNQTETKPKPNQNQTITKPEPKPNQTETKVEPKEKEKEKEKEKDKDNNKTYMSGKPDVTDSENEIYGLVIDRLNSKAGTTYKATSANTRKHIHARLNDGYTLGDFYTVIDKKVKEWKGTEWEKFLRPETLFGSKFENYLQQRITESKAPPGNRFNNFEQRSYNWQDMERRLIAGQGGGSSGS